MPRACGKPHRHRVDEDCQVARDAQRPHRSVELHRGSWKIKVGVRYCSAEFVREITQLGGMVQAQLDAVEFNSTVGALGIPSDLAILIDPVSVGVAARGRHDVLLVTCLALVLRSVVS